MFEAKIDQLRTRKTKLSQVALDMWLIFTYILSIIDLFETYYISSKFNNSIELNPLYHI